LFPLKTPLRLSRIMLHGWKENSMLTNCLAEWDHLTITVSEIDRDIGRKSSIFHTPFYSTLPLGGFPSEYRHPVWYGKTRMVWLPDGEKNCRYLYSFWRNSRTWRTDGQRDRQTPGDSIYRAYAYASRGKNRDEGSLVMSLSNNIFSNIVVCFRVLCV